MGFTFVGLTNSSNLNELPTLTAPQGQAFFAVPAISLHVYFLDLPTRTTQPGDLNVGHLLTSIWAGGLESFVLSLSRGVARHGIRSTVYSWTGDDLWREEFARFGIRIVPLHGPKRISSFSDLFRFASAWIRLVKSLREDRIHVMHTHDFLPSLVGRTASIMAGVRARVTTMHNLYDWWPRWVHVVNRLLSRQTQSITCVSESVRRFMIDRAGLPESRLVTVLNGVDEDRFKPSRDARIRVRSELGLGEHEILIGNVGSITTRKAHWILVKAVAPLIREGFPLQVRIWGTNTTNPQHAEAELLSLIRSENLEEQVKLLPPRRDIEDVYNAMDIHCMTSIAEGLSLASVEAMMCGIPPVYSDIGPFREVVRDGVNGRLFKTQDPDDLRQVLREVLANPDRRAALGQAARRSAVDEFGLARMVDRYAEIYKAVAV